MYSLRQFTWEDMAAVVAVMNAAALALDPTSEPAALEQTEARWRAPYNHPDRDCWVALHAGEVVGFGIADLQETPHFAEGVCVVHPDHPGAIPELIAAIDDYFLRVATETSPPDAPIYMHRGTSEKNQAMQAALKAAGYAEVRQFYTMRLDLTAPFPLREAPDGITIRPFDPSRDVQATYDAQNEAFADHWGFQYTPYEEWIHPLSQPDFDPGMWQIALDGEEVVGMALSQVMSPEYAWIGIVGVRPAWRGRGVALALLSQEFEALKVRGFTRVELGVDSNNRYKAVALYERAGMQAANVRLIFEKVFRGSLSEA